MFSETGKAGQPERKLEDHDSWYLTALGLSGNMLAGGQKPWWKYRENQDTTTQNDEMAYECDANLGAPSEIDCTRLEYSELGVPSDTVTILAGIPKMLFSGMCNLAISTLVTITITWAQVSAALDTLIDYCVSTQRPALGGKAYYKSSNNNRGRRKRVTSQVSGRSSSMIDFPDGLSNTNIPLYESTANKKLEVKTNFYDGCFRFERPATTCKTHPISVRALCPLI